MQASSRRSRLRRAPRSTSRTRGSRQRSRSRFGTTRKQGRRGITHSLRAKVNSHQNQAEKRRLNAEYRAAVKTYEAAVRAFQQQNYGKAKEQFEKLLAGPVLEVVERSRVHLRMCEQRLSPASPSPKGAAGYYNLGVAELNARRLEQAIQHLSKAGKMAPEREEVRYALAAAYALEGNTGAALEHLQAAITLRPQNRFQARHDEDFEALRSDARFQALVYS